MAGFDYDVLIMGSGPGGYVAGIRAAQLGLKAAVIERDKVGGVCLNIGCIPSKTLIHQAELFRSLPALKEMGIAVDVKGFDYKQGLRQVAQGGRHAVQGRAVPPEEEQGRADRGDAALSGRNEVTLKDGKKITGKNIVIATGSRPRIIPSFEFDEDKVLSSTGALMLQKLPKKAIILGAGAIGVEFSHVWNSFGVEVHLVEMMDRILPLEDAEAVQVLARSFQKRGSPDVHGHEGRVHDRRARRASASCWRTRQARARPLEADLILVAVGRTINTDGIGLEKVGHHAGEGVRPGGRLQPDEGPGHLRHRRRRRTRRCLRTSRSRRRRSPSSTSRASHPHPRLDPLSIPGRHLLRAAGGKLRPPRVEGRGERHRFRQGELPLPRRGQVGGRRAVRGVREGHLRPEDEGDPRRARGRRGGHRAHPRAAPGPHGGASSRRISPR